jgi:hypothetical protein
MGSGAGFLFGEASARGRLVTAEPVTRSDGSPDLSDEACPDWLADFSAVRGAAALPCACSRGRGRGWGVADDDDARTVVLATFGMGNGGTGLSSSARAGNPAAANSERDKDHAAVKQYLTRMISLVPSLCRKE